ncbi:MAG: exo-alpha-sialidase [Ruminococcaceae bacterium]|nr:exo-alpha-sialidase [Oscillospiraceae bacterium]
MRGTSKWYFRPYRRPVETEVFPYITRIIPREDGFSIDWIDEEAGDPEYYVYVRKMGTQSPWSQYRIAEATAAITGLCTDTDFEVYVGTSEGRKGKKRLVRTGKPVEGAVMVDYLHPLDPIFDCSGRALLSTSLVRVPSGALLAAVVVAVDRSVWPASPCLTRLHRSYDDGATWEYVCDILPSFDGSLFLHRNVLYFMTSSTDFGDVLLAASYDEGTTWTDPVTLFRGEGAYRWGWNTTSMAMLPHGGRLYKAIEYGHVAKYGSNRAAAPASAVELVPNQIFDLAHYLGMLSIDEDADLLVPENWSLSELYLPVETDPHHCIEGNAVPTPSGGLVNIVRTRFTGVSYVAAVDTDNPEKALIPLGEILNFPFSNDTKFEIKRDERDGMYIAVGNDLRFGRQVLCMAVSGDLETWRVVYVIADGRGGDDAFSYADWIFSGEDILVLSRTAHNGAVGAHDSNATTFHRIVNFRQYYGQEALPEFEGEKYIVADRTTKEANII